MPTNGIPPTRFRRGRSLPARSAFTARSIPATAATPTASRCRDAGRRPTRAAPRRPISTSSRVRSICGTISPTSSPIPSTAISFISTTTAFSAASMRRTSSRAGSPACRWRPKSACRAATTISGSTSTTPCGGSSCRPIRSDAVQEGSVGLFAQNTLHWTDWLRTIVGWRGDFYQTSVNSFFTPANSGSANAVIGSPKFGVVLGPFARTEFYRQRRRRISQQRRARRHHHGIAHRRFGAAVLAVSGQDQGSRGRAADQDHSETGQFGQPVPARFRVRDPVLRRCRRYHRQPAEPPLRRSSGPTTIARCHGSVSKATLPSRMRASAATIREQAALYASLAGFPAARSATRRATTFPARRT